MAKYKILFVSDSITYVKDYFDILSMTGRYAAMSCSTNEVDVENHLSYCAPDILMLCLARDSIEDMMRIAEMKNKLVRENVILGITGSAEECKRFQALKEDFADIVIHRPFKNEDIEDVLDDYMDDLVQMKQQQFEIDEQIRMIQKQKEKLKAEIEKNKKGTDQGAEKKRKHVLVIDDDPMMLKIVKEHLHDNYDVATAINGKIAYKFLDNKKTDLILLDYEMPNENGAQVLTHLKETGKIDGVPVVFLTGVAEQTKIKEILKLKPQGYLLKPIDKEKLLSMLKKFI